MPKPAWYPHLLTKMERRVVIRSRTRSCPLIHPDFYLLWSAAAFHVAFRRLVVMRHTRRTQSPITSRLFSFGCFTQHRPLRDNLRRNWKSTTKHCRDVFGRADSPPLFCFFRDGWLDDDPCTSADLVAWVASVGPTAGGTCFVTARAGFLATFLDPSKEAERDPSSYSFLLAVLFGWLLGGWKLNWLQFSNQGKNRIHMRINKSELSQRKSDVIWI